MFDHICIYHHIYVYIIKIMSACVFFMFSRVFSMGMHGNQASAETQTCRQGLYQLWRHFLRPKDTDGQGIHQETLDKDIQVVPKRWMR